VYCWSGLADGASEAGDEQGGEGWAACSPGRTWTRRADDARDAGEGTSSGDHDRARQRLKDAEAKLRRFQAAIEAGIDPAALVEPINQAQAEREAARAELANAPVPSTVTDAEIRPRHRRGTGRKPPNRRAHPRPRHDAAPPRHGRPRGQRSPSTHPPGVRVVPRRTAEELPHPPQGRRLRRPTGLLDPYPQPARPREHRLVRETTHRRTRHPRSQAPPLPQSGPSRPHRRRPGLRRPLQLLQVLPPTHRNNASHIP
jgi:hypothetical protein